MFFLFFHSVYFINAADVSRTPAYINFCMLYMNHAPPPWALSAFGCQAYKLATSFVTETYFTCLLKTNYL